MSDKRANDRRKKSIKVSSERRKGPRRLTCYCGGMVDAKVKKDGSGSFTCRRCGKKH